MDDVFFLNGGYNEAKGHDSHLAIAKSCDFVKNFHFKGDDCMKINDDILERLGVYFVYHAIYENYGITFETFVERWMRGILEV